MSEELDITVGGDLLSKEQVRNIMTKYAFYNKILKSYDLHYDAALFGQIIENTCINAETIKDERILHEEVEN